MSLYAAQSALETDYDFRSRVRACVVQETGAWTDPPTQTYDQIVETIMPDVAASPGFASLYLWGEKDTAVPGQAAVSDGQILATVQPLLEQFRPQE